MSQQQNDAIIEANSELLDAIGHLNTIKLIITALETKPHGVEVDEALHCLELATHGALRVIMDARQKLDDAEVSA